MSSTTEENKVFFFDIDNCLYDEASTDMPTRMRTRIHAYAHKIGIHEDRVEVEKLCRRYYKDYGLAVRGLLEHHDIDPVAYDEQVDGGLPLEEILHDDPPIRHMLETLKTRRWAFTNAGLRHGERVLKIIGTRHLFEGITYADYSVPRFPCKPEPRSYVKAMKEAGITDPSKCYLVDDSPGNVDAAKAMGWTAVHVTPYPEGSSHGDFQIRHVTELPSVLPELWEGPQM